MLASISFSFDSPFTKMFSTPLLIAALSAFASIAGAENVSPSQHNIVFIIVDDLDARMTSPEIMPSLKKHVVDQGTTFSRHYCTVSLCCPARASILTGQNAHNHNVTNVTPPEGNYSRPQVDFHYKLSDALYQVAGQSGMQEDTTIGRCQSSSRKLATTPIIQESS